MRTVGNMTLFFSADDEFSHWYPSPFEIKGVRFTCGEQFMMYCKAMLFGDEVAAEKILATKDPKEHKALGRSVQGYVESVWIERRERIVIHGNYAKFSQNPTLAETLIATEGTLLVEASPYDKIWGAGFSENDPRILNVEQWPGKNLLGKALTNVRERLVHELVCAVSTTHAHSTNRDKPRMG